MSLAWLWLSVQATAAMPVSAELPSERVASVSAEPSTLLVRIIEPAKMIGYPAVCPGSMPDEDQAQIVCLAELYEARVRILRHLGGPKSPATMTIRFTAHSFHAVWRKDVRFLVVVSPFEGEGTKGHFAGRWDWEDQNGLFCIDRSSLARDSWVPIRQLYRNKAFRFIKRDTDRWSKGAEIACATGWERTPS